jgi:hypothetical protein
MAAVKIDPSAPWTPPMSYSSNATGILLAAGYGVEVR